MTALSEAIANGRTTEINMKNPTNTGNRMKLNKKFFEFQM
jgi:hypothetical protein